ncbi:hypothetical protein MHJ94_09935 [Chryseobacterium taklimakanense]|jgi:hypothetical protein|uniref:hypothetical protein n=1 Tax=Chryseobacterium taklimakanense TaxID=536441 RepID=UPI001EF40E16|nr:hypothetical protein [Chryseobacterium taklimakanense]MCG7281610.1 hypothetical protein [Chryseobacterium taklimakanense]
MSDNIEKLPAGYEYIHEGGNQNRIYRYDKNNYSSFGIDSGVVDVKYNDNYLLVSVDTTYSMNPEKTDKKNLKYFIHDLKKDTIIKKISFIDLQKRIKKDKSLEDIDITK